MCCVPAANTRSLHHRPSKTLPPPQALLRRVFQTAADLWRDEHGALLHSRNYALLGASFRTWQLHVLERQEQRRQQILWNAAVAFRRVVVMGWGGASTARVGCERALLCISWRK